MRILFVMEHPGYARHYAEPVRLLADRGHQVTLAFALDSHKIVDLDYARDVVADERIEVEAAPQRQGMWRPMVLTARLYIDHLRYFHPDFEGSPKLSQRARELTPKILRLIAQRVFISGGYARIRHMMEWLQRLELTFPSDPDIKAYVRERRPDAVVVTPLVDFGSWLSDYVSEARRQGIHSAVCVASWDNLTNKGLMRVLPDMVLLWNHEQAREAVEYHGVEAERIVITGAQTFDPWFEMEPTLEAAEFRGQLGLPDDGHIILYVCSSSFICPVQDEVEYLKWWLECLRARDEKALADAIVIVRPHPLDGDAWADVDFHEERVLVWPKKGTVPVESGARSEFYDCLHHCSAVVGVNTSALIEAGIVGKPVHCYLAPQFQSTQRGTVHFRHLESGLLHMSSDVGDHFGGLAESLSVPDASGTAQEFIGRFVRPHGIDVVCAPLVADALESLPSVSVRADSRTLQHRAASALLAPLAFAMWLAYRFRPRRQR